jgi:hypothetical protein
MSSDWLALADGSSNIARRHSGIPFTHSYQASTNAISNVAPPKPNPNKPTGSSAGCPAQTSIQLITQISDGQPQAPPPPTCTPGSPGSPGSSEQGSNAPTSGASGSGGPTSGASTPGATGSSAAGLSNAGSLNAGSGGPTSGASTSGVTQTPGASTPSASTPGASTPGGTDSSPVGTGSTGATSPVWTSGTGSSGSSGASGSTNIPSWASTAPGSSNADSSAWMPSTTVASTILFPAPAISGVVPSPTATGCPSQCKDLDWCKVFCVGIMFPKPRDEEPPYECLLDANRWWCHIWWFGYDWVDDKDGDPDSHSDSDYGCVEINCIADCVTWRIATVSFTREGLRALL